MAFGCSSQTTQKGYALDKNSYPQLDSLITKIIQLNKSDVNFIIQLEESQNSWEKYVLSDLSMRFPSENKTIYGSIYPSCRKIILDAQVKQRITFLKQWTDGINEGELCSGTIPIIEENELDHKELERQIRLHNIMELDTIVFDKDLSLQEFVKLVDVEQGLLTLRNIKSGKFDLYNPIKSNEFLYETGIIKPAIYSLEIKYGFENKSSNTKRIRKYVRIDNSLNIMNKSK